MKLFLNGQEFNEIPETVSFADFLALRKISEAGTVASVNGQIIKPDEYAAFILHENDRIDLMVFSSGG